MQCRENSGWWLPESPHSMASIGWIVGNASEMFAMSVEPGATLSSSAGNTRPSASAFR